MKMTDSLTDEQKQQVIAEFVHYLEMDSYDFSISVGPFTVLAGAIADQAEAAMMELSGEDFGEDEFVDEDVAGAAPAPGI